MHRAHCDSSPMPSSHILPDSHSHRDDAPSMITLYPAANTAASWSCLLRNTVRTHRSNMRSLAELSGIISKSMNPSPVFCPMTLSPF